MELIQISEHPNLIGIERKVEIANVQIDLSGKIAILTLNVHHFKDKFLWDELGIGKVPVTLKTGYVTKEGIPCDLNSEGALEEFDVLFGYNSQENFGRTLIEIVTMIVLRNDKMGLFNNLK